MIEMTNIDHLNVHTTKYQEMLKFYNEAFGLKAKEKGTAISTNREYTIVGKPGSLYLALYDDPKATNEGNKIQHFGVHVHNFEEAYELSKKNGWLNNDSVYDYEKSKSFYIYDPDGNEIEISKTFGAGLN